MDITKVLKMIEEDDMYIPSDVAAFLSRPKTAEGIGIALIIPDWNNDKVTADYTRTLRSKAFKNCLDSESKTSLTNTRFKLKIEDGKYYVSHRDLAGGGWVEVPVEFPGTLEYGIFHEMLSSVKGTSDKALDGSYKDINIAYCDKFPGIPFFTNKANPDFKRLLINGTKRMSFVTLALYKKKKTKSWKPGYRYVDADGNCFTIVGKANMNPDIYALLSDSLKQEKNPKKVPSERDFTKLVVDILNKTYTPKEKTSLSTGKSADCQVYFTIRDNSSSLEDIVNRGLDLYEKIPESYTLQMIPASQTFAAYEVEQTFKEEDLAKTPIDIKKVAENTLELFHFGQLVGDTLTGLLITEYPNTTFSDGVMENLLYLSSITDESSNLNPDVKNILNVVLEQSLKETMLFDKETLNPSVSYKEKIDTVDIIKRANIYLGKILKHCTLYEKASRFINDNIVNLSDLILKVKDEVKSQSGFIFSSWNNYDRYVNYTTIPYLVDIEPTKVSINVTESIFKTGIKLSKEITEKYGEFLGEILTKIVNTALSFNGYGVSHYGIQRAGTSKDKEPKETTIYVTVTYNNIKSFFGGIVPEEVANDILNSKFFKVDFRLTLEVPKKEEE